MCIRDSCGTVFQYYCSCTFGTGTDYQRNSTKYRFFRIELCYSRSVSYTHLELPLVDYILVPIGGGGLATGVSTLAKLLNPKIKVIGVEPANANCMQESIKNGKVTTLPSVNTLSLIHI